MTEEEMYEAMQQGKVFSPPEMNDDDLRSWIGLSLVSIGNICQIVHEMIQVDDRDTARALGDESHFMQASDAWTRVMHMSHNVDSLFRERFLNHGEMHEIERRKAELQLGHPVKAVRFGPFGFVQVVFDEEGAPDDLSGLEGGNEQSSED